MAVTKTAYVTYMIYTVLYEALILGGCGYAVFVLGHSGWWFLLAVLLSAGQWKPRRWYGFMSKYDEEKESA